MAIMKSEQIMSESKKSFEDAIQIAVTRFSKTVRNLRSANVNNMSTVVDKGKVVMYRVNLQMTLKLASHAKRPRHAKSKLAKANSVEQTLETAGPGLSTTLARGFPCWSVNERTFSITAHTENYNLHQCNDAQWPSHSLTV